MNRKMSFTSIQKLDDTQEKLTYNVDVKVVKQDDYYCIDYLEPSEGKDNIEAQLKFNENEVHLYRKGDITSEMHFYKDKQSFGEYDVMKFTIDLGIGLKDLFIKEDKIIIDYDLQVNHMYSGNFKIEIYLSKEQ